MADFLSQSDIELNSWAINLASHLGALAAQLDISPADVEAYIALQRDFTEKLQLARDPATMGRMATCRKDDARTALKAESRSLVRRVRVKKPASDVLIALGLRPIEQASSPRTIEQRPDVTVESVAGHSFTLKLAESMHHHRRPAGTIGATIEAAVVVGETITAFAPILQTRSRRVTVTLDCAITPGTRVYFRAAWLGVDLRSGPMSTAVMGHVQFSDVPYGMAQAA